MGSSNGGLISRGHSTIGMGHKGGHAERTSIAIGSRGDSSQGSSDSRASNDSSIDTSMGLEVFSTGSNNSGLIGGGHSTIGVGNQSGHVERTSITIGSRGNSSQGSSDSRASNDSSIDTSMGLEVFSTSSNDS